MRAEAAAADSRAELQEVKAERARAQAALQEAEAAHREAMKARCEGFRAFSFACFTLLASADGESCCPR